MRLPFSFLNRDTWSVELASAGVLCLWGAVLLMPYATFTSNAVFQPMLSLMPHEWVWGIFFGTLGLMQLVALRRDCPRWRGYVAAVNAAPYMFLAASHFVGSPHGVVFGVYLVFVVCNWWAAWSARVQGG